MERGRGALGNWASQAELGGLLSAKKIRTRRNALAVEYNQLNIQVQVGCNAACSDPSDYLALKILFKTADLCHTRVLMPFNEENIGFKI